MKYKNITAFLLGLLAAGLLWQYYLKPKYLIKKGDGETIAAIHRADIEALNKATQEIEGEVLFKDYGEAQEPAINERINNGAETEEEFEFHSTANKEENFFEQAARPRKKDADIYIGKENSVMYPSSIDKHIKDNGEDLSSERISMIVIPAQSVIISAEQDYRAYQKAHSGTYEPVDFTKNRIVFVESADALSNGFFQIKEFEEQDDKIKVYYKVNIFGVGDRPEQAPSILVPSGSKPVEIQQVK